MNYWNFCHHLKAYSLNVLDIGDQSFDELMPGLKASLPEYYKVGSLENYNDRAYTGSTAGSHNRPVYVANFSAKEDIEHFYEDILMPQG